MHSHKLTKLGTLYIWDPEKGIWNFCWGTESMVIQYTQPDTNTNRKRDQQHLVTGNYLRVIMN